MPDIPYPEDGDKKAVRAFYRRRLPDVVPQGTVRKAAESQIRYALSHIVSAYSGASLAVFNAYGHEPDITPVFEEWHNSDYTLCMPCNLGKNKIPLFRRYIPGDTLQSCGRPAFTQPLPDKPIISPDIIICPLLAFDSNGNRLGQGGGYYDRAIAYYKPACTIGAAFSALKALKTLPVEPHDVLPDYVVTEKETSDRLSVGC